MDKRQAYEKISKSGKSSIMITTVIEEIYDAHEAELKAKDERIAELVEKLEIENKWFDTSVKLAEENCLQKTKITELEAMVKKMKCCTNCAITSFDYDYEDCKECQNESLWRLKDNK